MATMAEEINAVVANLAPSDQQRVLNYVRELSQTAALPHTPLPEGTPPEVLLRFTVSPEVGEAMQQAIEESEQVDMDDDE
jgi:hypothetical protein